MAIQQSSQVELLNLGLVGKMKSRSITNGSKEQMEDDDKRIQKLNDNLW